MRTILPRSQLPISRIALGLAALHHLDKKKRRQLLEGALDSGITHFDTARFYGDGLSERSLGMILGARRRSLTIATKFGLLPTPFIGSMGFAGPFARKGRSLLAKLGVIEYPRRSYTKTSLQKSLAGSLRALGTDYIDIYFFHEPPEGFVPVDDVIEELTRQKIKGTIRLIGVSGDRIDTVVQRYGALLDVVQCAESSWAAERYVPDITYSLFSRRDSPIQARQGTGARALLERALARRDTGAVVVQTGRTDHLREVVSWAARS